MEETNPPPSSTPLIPKKLSNAVRLIMFMIQKGVSIKRKRLMILIPDLGHVMMERGKVLGKSFNDLMIRHNTALGCSSHDVRMSFVSPREYEFSCSSTPPHRIYSAARVARNNKRKNGGGRYRYVNDSNYNNIGTNNNNNKHVDVGYYKQYYGSGNTKQDDVVSVVSSVKSSLRGGAGGSTNGGDDDEFPVDKAAEEFIERFYRELLLQKLNLARETTATVRFG
ncbi:uncharacterized protein LOC133803482 [Humulus lupulus]|uniref:uncharacterized protein LOC133803482 n=1 Tax=Humulus lupulus TaxID=3486 RepID=UPI002B40C477|nr:uncharacterized protein LOC133803482 [Humulus lupulus]